MAAKKIVIVDDEESIRKTFFLILNKLPGVLGQGWSGSSIPFQKHLH